MKEEDNESQDSKHYEQLVKQSDLIEINDKKRNIIFLCLTIIAIFSSCDGGIIPQQNTFIQEDFGEKGEQRVGLFGSIDYSGRVVGALIFTVIMGKMNRKMLLVYTLLFKSITLFIPLFTINYYINSIARGLSGLSQVFYPTYLPVWCDQYGKKNKKTIWVMIVQIGNPLGIIIGYGFGLLFEKLELFGINGWRTSFAIEGIILIISAIIINFFEEIYFSEKFLLVEDSKGKEEEIKDEQKKVTLFANIGTIICNKIFLFSSLCNSVAFFGIGVVQFYGDKYFYFEFYLYEISFRYWRFYKIYFIWSFMFIWTNFRNGIWRYNKLQIRRICEKEFNEIYNNCNDSSRIYFYVNSMS